MKDLVFLTYSFKDLRRVRRLQHALQMHGLRVWPGRLLMPGTPVWTREVNDRLGEALCVIALLSTDATLSRWVAEAVHVAHERQIPVLPAVIDGEPGHILLVELDGEDWFDLRWSKNYMHEVRAMVEVIRQLAASAASTIEANS